jgi:N-sulfoglucosamine sulfohydrolase
MLSEVSGPGERIDMKNYKCIALVAAATQFFSFAQAKEQPNILLIIADDLGPQLGCYGDANSVSPNIDKLAEEGVRFNQAHVTAASCSPSRGSIMTGLYPHQHGMYSLSHQGWAKMHDDVPKLPNAMNALGYRTAIVGKTHYEPGELFEWDLCNENTKKVIIDRDVRWMNAQAEKWLDESPQDKPFLLCMSYVDPHRGGGDGRYGPNRNEKFPRVRLGLPEHPLPVDETVPVPFLGVNTPEVRMENSDYYSCIQRLDAGVGELMEMLEEKDALDNTLIVFIGDHGPDLTRGKISVYATATHIPMLVKWPGHTKPGLVRDDLVSTIDLFPTFVEAAGGEITDERQTGRPLQPLMKSGSPAWREWLGTEFIAHVPWHYYPRYSMLNGRYQLVRNLAADRDNPLEDHNYCYAMHEVMKPQYAGTPLRAVYDAVLHPQALELFDVQSDPFLMNNLAANPERKQMVEEFGEQIDAWRKQTKDPFLDPAFAEAYAEHVAQQKTEWEIRNGIRQAAPPKKEPRTFPKVGPETKSKVLFGNPKRSEAAKEISFDGVFDGRISRDWNSPNGHPGQATAKGVTVDLSENGFSMTRQVDEAGLGAGRVEASAVFVQSPEAVPHAINWNVGFSSENTKYIQNAGGDSVCARFVTAGKNKGRIWWSIYNDGKPVGKDWSAKVSNDWKPGDEIKLSVSYDFSSGTATAVVENLTDGHVLARDTVMYPGIGGLRYTGFEMTMFPKNATGSPGAVKSFSFNSTP